MEASRITTGINKEIKGGTHIDTLQGKAILPDLPNREMVYNDAGRLYQLIEEGNLQASYIYNDMGQRTRKTIYQADGTTVDSVTIYHYDRMGMLVTETTETGVLMKDYVWNGGVIAAQITATDAGNTGNAGAVTSEAIIYLYTDHLMTNRLAIDDNQQVVWRWEGEAFGNTPAEELGGVSVNLRFPGQYFDSETNLHYNMFRYYDPQIGRYITSDPIGLRAGPNTYIYSVANPIRFTDVKGLAIWGKFIQRPTVVNEDNIFFEHTLDIYKQNGLYIARYTAAAFGTIDFLVLCKDEEGCENDQWIVSGPYPVFEIKASQIRHLIDPPEMPEFTKNDAIEYLYSSAIWPTANEICRRMPRPPVSGS